MAGLYLVGGAIALLSAFPLTSFTLRPLERSPHSGQSEQRYFLVDLVVLIALLSLVGGVFAAMPVNPADRSAWRIFSIFAFVYFLLIWWAGIGLLARAGVTQTARRALFLGLVMPIGLLSSITLPAYTLVGLAVLLDPVARRESLLGASLPVVWFIGEFLLIGGVLGGHCLGRWVAGVPVRRSVESPASRRGSSDDRDTAQEG